MDRIDEFFGTAFKKYIVYVGHGIEMMIASFIMLGAAFFAAITIPFVLLGWLGKSLGICDSKKPRADPSGCRIQRKQRKRCQMPQRKCGKGGGENDR